MESPIVDWEYYNSLYSKVSETDFTKAESLAEKQVKLVIGQIRWNLLDSTETYVEQLKDCICNTIDKMSEQSASGRGIASISNDGYSESYTVQTQTQAIAELQSCIRAWLSGTGLAGAY